MSINPGSGYTFISSASGMSLDISSGFDEPSVQLHPFEVYLSEKDGETYSISVEPGMLNNLDPQTFDTGNLMTSSPTPKGTLVFNGDGDCWIYLRAGPTPETPGEEVLFPDPDPASDGYPMVIISDSQMTDSDDYGYILLAKAKKNTPPAPASIYVTLTQYVSGSLWGERFKCGDATASYWFAGV